MENITITKKIKTKNDVADLLNQIFSIVEEKEWMLTIILNKLWDLSACATTYKKEE